MVCGGRRDAPAAVEEDAVESPQSMLRQFLGPNFWPGSPRCAEQVLGALLTQALKLTVLQGLRLLHSCPLGLHQAQQQLAVLLPVHARRLRALHLVRWSVAEQALQPLQGPAADGSPRMRAGCLDLRLRWGLMDLSLLPGQGRGQR